MNKSKKLINDFAEKEELYSSFCKKLTNLIESLIEETDIITHQITSRIKSATKLDEKIDRKKDKYSDINEITDLVGIRIITYLEDEVDKIANLIKKEFTIDIENSVDKRVLETNQFGYRSLHYVLELNDTRSKLQEYKRFKNLKAEIQIRSILQHAWAEIEHDIGYKGEYEIPDFAKRRFNRIAALLETADVEFVLLKKSLSEYEISLPSKLENAPDEVNLDKASLEKFIDSSIIINSINGEISERLGLKVGNNFGGIEGYLARMQFSGIKTIDSLSKELQRFAKQIPIYIEAFIEKNKNIDEFSKGWPIFYLGYILATEDNNEEKALQFISKIFPERDDPKRLLNRMMNARKKITVPNSGLA